MHGRTAREGEASGVDMSNKEKTVKRWLPVVRLPHPGNVTHRSDIHISMHSATHAPKASAVHVHSDTSSWPVLLCFMHHKIAFLWHYSSSACCTPADGAPAGELGGMQSIPSGSFSHPGSSSNRDSSVGGSSHPQSMEGNTGGKLMSSLNVLAKPFVGPGTEPSPSDSQSLGLKSPRQLPVMPGPCPSQVNGHQRLASGLA